ncbi:hypothetical protein BDZ94DRAFT_1264200 [Collybia nuda]|uniref:Uncharacterized protein n=1 Tax=Collybia nuda TaxID=64659 RepID=A0A9P5Y2Q0_9AGAR|nr:hypothetical protein BDZ94DRAFT_1264200 [Collybia nuda]
MSDNDPPPLSESEDDNEDDPPPAKRIPKVCEERLLAIEKLIRLKKTVFAAGHNGLQAYRARAIQSHLQMVVNNGCHAIEASEMAAESQGFARKWGGRLVQIWVRRWILWRELPVSLKGKHVKVFSLLDDPSVCAELRSFLRSNKWSMDPKKLMEFKKYLHHIVESEMPRGLKKYLEVELFPRIQLKVARGVSVCTARHWLHRKGFKFTEHKKSIASVSWNMRWETLKRNYSNH